MLLQCKRDQNLLSENDLKVRYFKNYVRNEEMKEVGTQTEILNYKSHKVGLGINMYNAQ